METEYQMLIHQLLKPNDKIKNLTLTAVQPKVKYGMVKFFKKNKLLVSLRKN